jgi:hypothetical protein
MATTDTPKTTTTRRPRKAKAETPPAASESVASESATIMSNDKPKPPRGKLGVLVELLRRPEGATIEAMMAATGWQAHSVRGVISGALKKKLGLTVTSEKTDAGRTYRIADAVAA